MAEPGDLELVESARRGGREAFGELVRRHHPLLLAACLSLLGEKAEAEDAAAESFVKAFEALPGFRGESSFPTWLHRIAVNACRDRQRRRARRPTVSWDALVEERGEELASLLSGSEDPRARVENEDLARRVLASLPEGHREILVLRETSGLSYQELAEVLDLSLDAVKARLKRARAEVAARLRHFFPPESV